MIATLDEFAYAIRAGSAAAAKHQLLLELAEGLVVDELGERDTYPAAAKAVVLGAAARAYFNLAGTQQEELSDSVRQPLDATTLGVYLTDTELDRLHGPTQPTYCFPCASSYPDPADATADTVSG